MLKKFGADLRKIRESKKISLRDISSKTRIHFSHFDKMENGDFGFFESTYIRAILKQYAKSLGLDADNVLFNYELAKNGKYNSGLLSEYLPELTKKNEELQELKPDISVTLASGDEKFPKDAGDVSDTEVKKNSDMLPENKNENQSDAFSLPDMADDFSDISRMKEAVKTGKRKFSSSKRIKIEGEKGNINGEYYKDDGLKIPYSFLKSAGVVLLVLLLLAGIYLLIDVAILQKKEGKTDLIKPNFDDIVKENEKKILGKKTEEEIRDSIEKETARLDSLKMLENDSLVFAIKAFGRGTIYVTTDTLAENKLIKQKFNAGDSLIFKAKKTFWVTSKNTDNFRAYLNGEKVKFGETEIKSVRITKKGIHKKILNKDGNESGKKDTGTTKENF